MAIARMAALWTGATALLGALGLSAGATYLWFFTSCAGDAECMGSFVTLFLFALVLSILGVLLVIVGRGSRRIRTP